MTKLNSINKNISKEDLQVSFSDPLKIISRIFNGLVIQIE